MKRGAHILYKQPPEQNWGLDVHGILKMYSRAPCFRRVAREICMGVLVCVLFALKRLEKCGAFAYITNKCETQRRCRRAADAIEGIYPRSMRIYV